MATLSEILRKYRDKIKSADSGCGIYFLMKGEEVVYIGQSTKIHNRIDSHRGEKDFDKAYYFECPEGDLLDIERQLIRGFSPKYNKSENFLNQPKSPWNAFRVRAGDPALAESLRKRIAAGMYDKETIDGLVALTFISKKLTEMEGRAT